MRVPIWLLTAALSLVILFAAAAQTVEPTPPLPMSVRAAIGSKSIAG